MIESETVLLDDSIIPWDTTFGKCWCECVNRLATYASIRHSCQPLCVGVLNDCMAPAVVSPCYHLPLFSAPVCNYTPGRCNPVTLLHE